MEILKWPLRLLNVYWSLFQFIGKERIKRRDCDLNQMHCHLISVLTTIPLLWFHVFLVCSKMGSALVLSLATLVSFIHMLSPLLFRWSNSPFLISNIMLAAASFMVTLVAFYTGGFSSFSILWYAAGPMIGGMVAGRRGALTWAILDFIFISIFFFLEKSGISLPRNLSSEGVRMAHYLLVYGWLALSAVLSFVFVIVRDNTDKILVAQSEKIDDLFRVLFHDLANSLGRIGIGVSIAKKQVNLPQTSRGIEIVSQAADSMFEITQNVRNMYAVSKGKADVDLELVCLNTSIEYLAKIFSADLERKNLRLEYDYHKNAKLKLLIEPVSFKNQVLGNILSNAIKFSPEGSCITINAYPVNNLYYAVEIRDQGIGMPPTLLASIFDLNKKTSRPGTNGEHGTGFGMHIMKSFVEMYQGQVMVESFEAQESLVSGTTFKLILKGEWD